MFKIRFTARDMLECFPETMDIFPKDPEWDVKARSYTTMKDNDEYFEFIKDADGIILGIEPLTKEMIDRMPNLKCVIRRGSGYDHVDVGYCKEKGIRVLHTIGTVEDCVAELTLGVIVCFGRELIQMNEEMHRGIWDTRRTMGVKGTTLGLVGFGGIAQRVAELAKAFQMEVLYYDVVEKPEDAKRMGATYVTLDELYRRSDFISLHIPYNPHTANMFTVESCYRKMKPTAYFLNMARGGVAPEEELVRALKEGLIAGAYTDVYPTDPYPHSLLAGAPHTIMTPHIGTQTVSNSRLMNHIAAQVTVDYFKGTLDPKYIVV